VITRREFGQTVAGTVALGGAQVHAAESVTSGTQAQSQPPAQDRQLSPDGLPIPS
jgi:hypothetical protein